MENKCVICRAIIPEGRQVCPNCENKQIEGENMKKFLNEIDLTKAEKIAVVVFNNDGTTECGYYNMDLRDKALAKHELEINIIDSVVRVNKDRYFGEEENERV